MIRRKIFEPEHDIFRESFARWADTTLVPHREEWIAAGCVSREAWKSAGAQGFLCMWAEEEYGGAGITDYRFDQIVIEEVTWREPGFYIHLHNRVIGPYLGKFASPAQKARFMPGVVSGDTILAIGITEPGAGSDVAGMRSFAVEDGDHWVLNGAKTYISNGLLSDLVIVAARTDRDNPHAMGLFLVERGMPGFTRGKGLKKLGLKSQDTSELFFENVKIPKDNVLGDPTKAFKYMMVGLAEERLTAAIASVTRAERAFKITMDFITERRAFGRPIGTFQNNRFKMAELRTQIDVCWAFVDHCTMEHLEGQLSADTAAEGKLFTSEVEAKVVDECLQLHGGAGFMDEYEISRLYADARITRIFAGTSEIMKEIIGRGLGLDERTRK